MLAVIALVGIQAAALLSSTSPAGAAVPGLGFTQTGCDGLSDSVARLYTAGLGRSPEEDGFNFWMVEYTSGRQTFPSMANFFVNSAEFAANYGALDNLGFVQQMYRNVLGREGEQEGVDFWTGRLNTGTSRAEILMFFAESPENIANSGTVQPTLGPFNFGLTGAWDCPGWAPGDTGPPPSACDILTQGATELNLRIRITNLDPNINVNATIEIAGRIDGAIVELWTRQIPNLAPLETRDTDFVVPTTAFDGVDPVTVVCSFVTKSLDPV